MLRLEFHSDEQNSHKFWSVSYNKNDSWEVSWGRVGSLGQCQYINTSEAKKRVREKLNKGYLVHISSEVAGPVMELFPFGLDGIKVAKTIQIAKMEQQKTKEKKQPVKSNKKNEKDLWDVMIKSAKGE